MRRLVGLERAEINSRLTWVCSIWWSWLGLEFKWWMKVKKFPPSSGSPKKLIHGKVNGYDSLLEVKRCIIDQGRELSFRVFSSSSLPRPRRNKRRPASLKHANFMWAQSYKNWLLYHRKVIGRYKNVIYHWAKHGKGARSCLWLICYLSQSFKPS